MTSHANHDLSHAQQEPDPSSLVLQEMEGERKWKERGNGQVKEEHEIGGKELAE